jgi:hypothetical protein
VGPLAVGCDPPGPTLLTALAGGRLAWFPEMGVGYFPVSGAEHVYDEAYFDKYAAYEGTEMDRQLNAARVALVARHYAGELVDVGIGSGSFVTARPHTFGYDINSAGIRWLKHRSLWWSPYVRACEAVSLWDVLEHMPDFPTLLGHVGRFAFVALPVFEGPEHVLGSKHFRRDEHCWYFTVAGFLRVMHGLGWHCIEKNADESEIGRDCIASFAFRRRTG